MQSVLLRQSNICQVNSLPFDALEHQLEGDVVTDAFGRQEVRAFDNNVVRWRFNAAGEAESNARFVRWSDGSLQLQLGGETLDVAPVDISKDNAHLFARVAPPASILAATAPPGHAPHPAAQLAGQQVTQAAGCCDCAAARQGV